MRDRKATSTPASTPGSRCYSRSRPARPQVPVPGAGRGNTSITQAPAWTSLQNGGRGSLAWAYADTREPGRSTQTAASSGTGPALSSPLPGTALHPKVARQAGGQARAAGPTLTWRLCSPSRQAEIKATGVSLVGLPGAGTPQDPEAPASLDPGLARSLCKRGPCRGLGLWIPGLGWAHSLPETWVGPATTTTSPPPPPGARPKAGVPGLP